MTNRKYRIFKKYIITILCILPLLVSALSILSGNAVLTIEFNEIVTKFSLSNELANKIGECINTFGIEFDGEYIQSALIIMSNTFLIYTFYLFTEVLIFIPKMAIWFLDAFGKVGKE